MNTKSMLAALQGVTAYKDILTLPVMERALRLLTWTVHGDGPGGLEAYTGLFDQLRQEGFTVSVSKVKVSAGAGFIVALTGDIMTMPGLPKVPAAEKIDVDDRGVISGLF